MKKVLFVATVVKLHIMVFHIPYLEWFKKNGYEVHVCAKNDYDNKEDCRIPFCDKYYNLEFNRSPLNFRNFKVFNQLKKIIDSNEYDIIHCHTPIGGVLARLAANKKRKNGTRVIYTAHGFHFFEGAPVINWLFYYPIEKWLSRYTDVLITINEEDFRRAKKFNAKYVRYVPGVGVDVNKFNKVSIEKTRKRLSIGVATNNFMIVSVGELNKNKNHEVIIKAISRLENIEYVLCGKGPMESYLKQLSKDFGINERIHFLGYRNDMTEIYKTADLFVFPSFREGLSLSLIEAMASGLPVVCSDIRGNIDLIEEGKNGYLVKADDIEGFRNAINKVINSKKNSKEFGNANAEKVKKYALENVLEDMKEIYLECK